MLYDTRCADLARMFLKDNGMHTADRERVLAETIQHAVEGCLLNMEACRVANMEKRKERDE